MIRQKHGGRYVGKLAAIFSIVVVIISLWVLHPGTVNAGENGDDLVIFVNKRLKITALTVDQVRDFFLKQRKTWPGGQKTVPVNSKDPRLREAFRQKVLGMNPLEEQQYWSNNLMRARDAEPPKFLQTVKAVFRLSGSISYAYRKDVPQNVVTIVLSIPAR